MRRKNLKKSITAFALAAAMVASVAAPAVPASAAEVVEQVSSVNQVGDINAAGISLKDTVASGQVTKSWTFNYNNDALAESKYKITGKSYSLDYSGQTVAVKEEAVENEYTFSPTMKVLVFDKGDRTKPLLGSMSLDETGKYVVDSGYVSESYSKSFGTKYEFTINATDALTPGVKEVVGYILNEPAYEQAQRNANDLDNKAYQDAYAAYSNSTDPNAEEPDQSDYHTNIKNVSEADYYVATAPVEIEVGMEASISTTVTASSVQLSLDATGATGFEIYRKVGSKYVKVGTVSAYVYTDKGLDANTTYSYKVRPYYVKETKDAAGTVTTENVYGVFTTIEATTAGSAMNLKAKVNKKNKVELTWKKVKNATKYEIYRLDTSSNTSKISGGDANSFSSSKLIATVKKSKKKYTDSTVKTNRSYVYYVRAILEKNKNVKKDKERYVQDSASADISFGNLTNTTEIESADGSITLKWDKVYGADGYIIEKEQYSYEPVKAGSGSNASYVFGIVDPDGDGPMTADYYIYRTTGSNNYFLYKVNTTTGIAYPTDSTGVVETPYTIPDTQGEYYKDSSYYDDYYRPVSELSRYKYDAANHAYTADDNGDYVYFSSTRSIYVEESLLEKYKRTYNTATGDYDYTRDAAGEYYYDNYNYDTYDNSNYASIPYSRYSKNADGYYSYDSEGKYVRLSAHYVPFSSLERYNKVPYRRDADGNELYEYGKDDKGLYTVSRDSKTDSTTGKTTYTLASKSYEYAISGADVYECNSLGDIQYNENWDYAEVARIGKNDTSYKFAAETMMTMNKEVHSTTDYRIKAYKGTAIYGRPYYVSTTYATGALNKVTATSTANGIQITWTPVPGAAYYTVYRVPTQALVDNKDIGAYATKYGTQVTNYVEVGDPVAVDVAAWNAAVDASYAEYKRLYKEQKKAYNDAVTAYSNSTDPNATYPKWDDYIKVKASDYMDKGDRLNDKLGYHYQNYSYAQSEFTDADATAGILDYAGDIYSAGGYGYSNYRTTDDDGKDITPVWEYSYYPVVRDGNVEESKLKSGVSYTYYVQAHMATAKTVADYRGTSLRYDDAYYTTNAGTKAGYNKAVVGPQVKNTAYGKAVPNVSSSNYKDGTGSTVGVKTVGKATFTATSAASKAPKIKSVKIASGKVTIKIKKKIAGADYYKVYRSTSKKGKYVSVGVTKDAKTLKLVDKSVTKGKTYYYKVVAVTKNEANGEVESKASKVKKVKAK